MNKRELRKWREEYSPWERPVLTEGLMLHAHFEEKDWVKSLGARWQPDPSGKGGFWWMRHNQLDKPVPSHVPPCVNVFDDGEYERPDNILAWLNLNQMVGGTHGDVDREKAIKYLASGSEELEVQNYVVEHENGSTLTFTFYPDQEIVVIDDPSARTSDPATDGIVMTTDQGRDHWDNVMKSGFRLTPADSEV